MFIDDYEIDDCFTNTIFDSFTLNGKISIFIPNSHKDFHKILELLRKIDRQYTVITIPIGILYGFFSHTMEHDYTGGRVVYHIEFDKFHLIGEENEGNMYKKSRK